MTKLFSKITFISCIAFFAALQIACDDSPYTQEMDINNNMMYLDAPYENQVLRSTLVDFQWRTISQAKNYRLFVSTYDPITFKESLILDTSLFSSRFKKLLPPGHYLWSLQATNYVSTISSYVNTFSIDTSEVQATPWTKLVNILAPADSSIYSSSNEIILWWDKLEGAVSYDIMIVTPKFSSPVKIVYTKNFSSQINIVENIKLSPGNYEWRIRAKRSSIYYDNYSESSLYTEYSTRKIIVTE
jgi:hypothetical protein